MRTCRTCKVEKPLVEFYRDARSAGGRHYHCKPCTKARVRRRDAADPAAAVLRSRKAELKKMYGITLEQYDAMLAEQLGRCAICGCIQTTNLCVDHCHESGKVRGLLCRNCNLGLGNFRDDQVFLARAIEYLSE